jgi:hypothetical protein
VDPGEIRLGSVEVVLKGVNECGKKRPGLQPAGLSDGKNSFHPAVLPGFRTLVKIPDLPDRISMVALATPLG